MNIRIDLILSAIVLWPALLYGQEARTITMKQKPVVMGQGWEVKSSVKFDLKNEISNKGQVLQTVKALTVGKTRYKAKALATAGARITRLGIEFDEISTELTNREGKTRQVSPLSGKQFTAQYLREKHYFHDKEGEPVTKEKAGLIFDNIRPEIDASLHRHTLLLSLPKRPLKIGESFPVMPNTITKLLGPAYKIKNGKLTLKGSKIVDNVDCAVFELRFSTQVSFKNGVVFDIRGKGEVCSEIATSLHRSVLWEGTIDISGSGVDGAGNTLTFKGSGAMTFKNIVSYPKSKEIPAFKIRRVLPKPGQTWKESYQRQGDIFREVKRDGEILLSERMKNSYANSYTVKVLECSKKAITKAEISFGKTIERVHSPKESEKLLPMSNGVFIVEQKEQEGAKKTYTITKKDGSEVAKELKEAVYDKVKELFKEDRSEFLELLPQGPVPYGKVITIDPKAVMKLHDDDKDLKSASLKLVYMGNRLVNNRPAAVFQFSSRLGGVNEDGIRLFVESTGEYLFDIATGWPVGGTRGGTMKIEGEQTNEIGDKIEIRGSGPLRSRKRIEYSFKKKKRF